MLRFLSIFVKASLFVSALVLFSFGAVAQAQSEPPVIFTVLGPDGPVARVITTEAQCPEITIDGAAGAMQVRAAPDKDFPVTVCDAAVPLTAKSASVLGKALKLAPARLDRVVVFGDTGCRIKGDHVQACNDPTQWPFAPLAASAAANDPQLVIHVGDYHYRESPCVIDLANCAGSPWGDNWAAWNADFFTPARPLLQAAPWVIVPGNHEDCERAGIGFFRLMDPRPMPADCPLYTPPYALNYLDPQMIVIDDSAINDYEIEPAQVAEFTKQAQQINEMAHGTTWLLLHDPFYVFGHAGEENGKEKLFIDQLTLQQAFNNQFPPSVELMLAGHIHLFELLSFGAGRPPQLVMGNGGTMLDSAVTTPLKGLEIGGMPVEFGTNIAQFGYALLERGDGRWVAGIKNVKGGDMDRCVLAGGSLLCGQAALPVGGGEWGLQRLWFALGLVGAAILCIGLALGARSLWQGTRAR